MTQPLYSAIDLTGIRSQLIEELDGDVNIHIPETFPITTDLLNDFNTRHFTPFNINNILSLCDYLMIDDTASFVRFNMEVSVTEYILTEDHMAHYDIPKEEHIKMNVNDMSKYGLIKYIITPHTFPTTNAMVIIIDHIDNSLPLLSRYGHLKCLKFLIENNYKLDDLCELDEQICNEAAANGHLTCLQYLNEHNFPWSKDTCAKAAGNGHLNCLQYLHENGCSWTSNTCIEAASNGHLICLKWAKEHNCPWNIDKIGDIACKNGHLNILRYLAEFGHDINKYFSEYVGINGQLHVFKYFVDNGYTKLDNNNFINAINDEYIECLKYLHSIGCPNDMYHVLIEACDDKTIECFKFLHGAGYPWTHEECDYAAAHGHLKCLMYAHENGCQWSAKTCQLALNGKHLHCLKYLIENGCPIE
jgi:hypothetical protein